MALTYTTYDANSGTTSVASIASPTVSYAAGDVLNVLWTCNNNGTAATGTITDTAGLSWTLSASISPAGAFNDLYLWTATATASGSTVITVASSETQPAIIRVLVNTNAAAPANITSGSGSGTAFSATIAPTSSGSALWGMLVDWNGINPPAYAAGSGCTLDVSFNDPNAYNFAIVRPTTNPLASSSSFTVGATAAAGANTTWLFFEVPFVQPGTPRNALFQSGSSFEEVSPALDSVSAPGNSLHAAFTGIGNDNHTQYFNTARGDARYAALAHTQTIDTLTQSGAAVGTVLAAWNGTQWAPLAQPTLTMLMVAMGATQQSVSTTLANITSLALPMVANGVYEIEAFLIFQTAASTTGMNAGVVAPTGARCMVEITVPLTSTAAASQLRTTFPNAATATNTASALGTGVTAANSNHTARIVGIVRNGSTAGFCQLQFATEIAASAVTLQIGSTLSLTRIA